MVRARAIVSGSRGPGSSPGQAHCVVLLGKTVPLLSRCINGYRLTKCWGCPAMEYNPIQGGVEIFLVASCYKNQ